MVNFKAKPHGCCIFSMILHEAPSMETTTPKGERFPCWVAEWSIMENMQQQMWFCFYPSPISINISSYVYNALRLTPEIWFWAMQFASFQIDINKYFAIVSPRCQVISNCDVMSPWITWQNNRLMISRFAILSREYLLQTALCNQQSNGLLKETYKRYTPFTFGINNKSRVARYGMNAMITCAPELQLCKLGCCIQYAN